MNVQPPEHAAVPGLVPLGPDHRRMLSVIERLGPVLRSDISAHTSRWGRERRNKILGQLERFHLIARQPVPAKGRKGPSEVFWLTEAGTAAVQQLREDGEL